MGFAVYVEDCGFTVQITIKETLDILPSLAINNAFGSANVSWSSHLNGTCSSVTFMLHQIQ
jgi:hypothetical protein